jgi:hypothetical protein
MTVFTIFAIVFRGSEPPVKIVSFAVLRRSFAKFNLEHSHTLPLIGIMAGTVEMPSPFSHL